MTLVRWQPRGTVSRWAPNRDVEGIQNEMNRMFDWFFGRESGESLVDSAWIPAVDIFQDADNYHVHVDLPGMQRDDIDITMSGDSLTISGEKKRESKQDDDNFFRVERSFGRFSRSMRLPSSVDAERISAKYQDGVLQIVIPKAETARPKQIKVQS
ncbi:MAG: Hsp20 family protein [Candidatus Eisenbacteria bacterium]|nr:Hsp20 family protein [Candidatus Latescibacterota bacterium]MBD3301449.1 Hsp20 family protein [Candidatus Eisenbacteria bacterium]